MSETASATGKYLRVYEVKVVLKNREYLHGYCYGYPYTANFGEWLYLSVEMPCKGRLAIKTEEIAYILYRPRRGKE